MKGDRKSRKVFGTYRRFLVGKERGTARCDERKLCLIRKDAVLGEWTRKVALENDVTWEQPPTSLRRLLICD